MDSISRITEEIGFKCKLHGKPAQAFCKEEACQDRILCYMCIRNSHPHHEDKFQNIVDIFKLKKPVNDQCPKENELFQQEFKEHTQSINKCYKKVNKEFVWLDYLAKIVQSNSSSLKSKSDSIQLIKAGLESLIAQSPDKRAISDSPELSQLINRYLLICSGCPGGNDKILSLQKTIQRLFEELVGQLNQLTNEISNLTETKSAKEEIWRSRKKLKAGPYGGNHSNTEKPSKGASMNESTSERPKTAHPMNSQPIGTASSTTQKPGDLSQSVDTLQKLYPPPTRGFWLNTNMPPTAQSQGQVKEKSSAIIIPEDEDSHPGGQEPFPTTKSAKPNQKPDGNVLKHPSHIGDVETMKQDIKSFFESSAKASIQVFEDWFLRTEKINLDSQLRFNLQRQKVIIEAFNKTKKQFDIYVMIKDTERFVAELGPKIPKTALRQFEENLNNRKQMLIEEERNWLDDSKIEGLLSLMKDSRVEFSTQEEELRSRLKYFSLYWKEIEAKIDLKRVQKIEFVELEQIIRNLWGYRVKFPLMEKLLEKYFECKMFQVAIKYYLIRYKQLENERFKLFAQGTDHNQLAGIVEQLNEISLSLMQPVKKKGLELAEKVDFGPEFAWFSKLVEDSEHAQKTLNETILKSNSPDLRNTTLIQTQIISSMHAFYFKDMIHLRTLYLRLEPIFAADIRADPIQSTSTTPARQIPDSSSVAQQNESNPVTISQNQPITNQTPHKDRMIEELPSQTQQTLQTQQIQQLPKPTQIQNSTPLKDLRDVMIIEEDPQPTQQLSQLQGTMSQKPTPEVTLNPISTWVRDTAKYIAFVLERSGNAKKCQEINQMVAKFESGSDVAAQLCLLCLASTQDLLKYCISKEKEALNTLLARASKLQPPFTNEIQKLISYLNTISWTVHTNDILKKPTQTMEELEGCLANYQQRQLDISANTQAQGIQDRITKFKELKTAALTVQKIDLRKVIADSSFESLIGGLENLEKMYKQICIEEEGILKLVEANLVLFRQGEKISKHISSPQKYKLKDLEQFYERVNSCFQNEGASNGFVLMLNHVVAQVRKDQAEFEQSKELSLAQLTGFLDVFLQNTVTRHNFVEKIAEVKAKLTEFRNRLNNLSIEFEQSDLGKLETQLTGLMDIPFQGGLKQKKVDLSKYITVLENPSADPLRCLLYWAIIVSTVLKAKKFSMKFYGKLVVLSDAFLKREIISANVPLFQGLTDEFSRIKSLHTELVLVKGMIKAKKLRRQAPSKNSFRLR